MNTGIGDAVNLAWKLAAVLQRARGRVAPRQLRTGAHRLRAAAGRDDRSGVHRRDERRAIARLVRLNDRAVRVPADFRFAAMRRFMFRTVSQTAVNYRESSLSEGRAGAVHGGDRLPWVKATAGRRRQLRAADVARLAGPRVRATLLTRFLRSARNAHSRCTSFRGRWRAIVPASSATPCISYSPDGYVGLAAPEATPEALTSYSRCPEPETGGVTPRHRVKDRAARSSPGWLRNTRTTRPRGERA